MRHIVGKEDKISGHAAVATYYRHLDTDQPETGISEDRWAYVVPQHKPSRCVDG
jgi:hypothetical protein